MSAAPAPPAPRRASSPAGASLADGRAGAAAESPAGFPGGARFAFTLLDDTDDATVENVRPVYDLLHELGLRTTKTVWPLDCPEGSRLYFAGQTLQDPEYRAFVHTLVERGFELAFHGATMESSRRERTQAALRWLDDEFGVPLRVHCNHGQNLENLYWGAERYRSALLRGAFALAERIAGRPRFRGHDPASPWFWGDLCRARFRFVRGFAFATLDSGAIPPHGPYRLRSTPWVNHWFNTADAPDAARFVRLVTRAAVDRLRDRGGVCILSTHLGKGFSRGGRVLPQVEDALRYVAAQPGWFAPVSDVLEHQLALRPARELAAPARWGLELRHVADRVRARLLARRTASVFP